MKENIFLKNIFAAVFLFLALFGVTTVSAQDEQQQHSKEKKKTEKKENPLPTPEEKKMKDHQMHQPTPTPTPTPMKMDEDMRKDKSSKKENQMDMPMKMDEPKPSPTPVLKPYPFPLPPPGKDFPKPIEDSHNYGKVMIELFEYEASANGNNALTWDASGWYGGDYNRFWFRSEAEIEQASKSTGDVEFQVLYGRLIAPFYDFQVGLRVDHKWEGSERNSRFHAVVGLNGLVPYEYEVEPLMFVSNKGDVSFRFTGIKDIFINQRTIFEGRFETNIAVQKVEKFGIGSGLNDMEFGIRIRREITREFAPYIGVSYKRLFGETADFARFEGERTDRVSLVAGVRMWF